MVDHNKNKLRTIRIYCTYIDRLLFAAVMLGPFLFIYYFRNDACSAREAENLAEWGFAIFLVVLAVSSFFGSLGAALQDHYQKWQRIGFFLLCLAVYWTILLVPYFLPQMRLRIEMDWNQTKSTMQKFYKQHPGQSLTGKNCVLHSNKG